MYVPKEKRGPFIHILKKGSSGVCAIYGQKLSLAKTGGKEREA